MALRTNDRGTSSIMAFSTLYAEKSREVEVDPELPVGKVALNEWQTLRGAAGPQVSKVLQDRGRKKKGSTVME